MGTDIKTGETASADVVMNMTGSMFNDTAQLLFNADYIGFNSKLTNSTSPSLKNVKYSTFTSDDADTNTGFNYDASGDFYDSDETTSVSTLIFKDTTTTSVTNVIPIINFNPWIEYNTTLTSADFTGASIPSGWTSTTSGIDTTRNFTWDATNDEADCSIQDSGTGGSAYNGTVGMYYNTAISYGQVRTGIRNMTVSANTQTTSFELKWGADYIHLTRANNSSNWFWKDSIGGSVDTGSSTLPSTYIWLKIEKTELGNVKTSYSTSGDSGYTVLSGNGTGTISSSNPQSCVIMSGNLNDNVETIDGSVYGFIIGDNSIPTEPDTSQISVSANGGTNWTNVNNAEIVRLTAGTALWRKIVITKTDVKNPFAVTEQAVKYNLY